MFRRSFRGGGRKACALSSVSFRCPEGRITCLLGAEWGRENDDHQDTGWSHPARAGLHFDARRAPAKVLSRPPQLGRAVDIERPFFLLAADRAAEHRFLCNHVRVHREGSNGPCRCSSERRRNGGRRRQAVSSVFDGNGPALLLTRALLSRPQVLLPDERTAHLDPNAKTDMQNLIRKSLAAGGRVTVALVHARPPRSPGSDGSPGSSDPGRGP